MELGVSQGFNEGNGSIALSVSRKNKDFGAPMYRNLGVVGQYGRKLAWNYPGGLGGFDGFMGLRLYTTENIVFSSDYLIANIRA